MHPILFEDGFEMVNNILKGYHLSLMTPTKPFDFDIDDSKKLFETLKQIMIKNNGIGLAANQIGINKRVFVYRNFEVNEDGETITNNVSCVFNPVVIGASDTKITLEEGCLSFPGLIVDIERHDTIWCEYYDVDGNFHNDQITGMNSRIWQHEIDHLDGDLFFNRIPRVKRDLIMDKWRKNYVKLSKKIA